LPGTSSGDWRTLGNKATHGRQCTTILTSGESAAASQPVRERAAVQREEAWMARRAMNHGRQIHSPIARNNRMPVGADTRAVSHSGRSSPRGSSARGQNRNDSRRRFRSQNTGRMTPADCNSRSPTRTARTTTRTTPPCTVWCTISGSSTIATLARSSKMRRRFPTIGSGAASKKKQSTLADRKDHHSRQILTARYTDASL
jgi:hypothetical protein